MTEEARLLELARRLWPGFEVHIARSANTATLYLTSEGDHADQVIDISAPNGRAFAALEAALRELVDPPDFQIGEPTSRTKEAWRAGFEAAKVLFGSTLQRRIEQLVIYYEHRIGNLDGEISQATFAEDENKVALLQAAQRGFRGLVNQLRALLEEEEGP